MFPPQKFMYDYPLYNVFTSWWGPESFCAKVKPGDFLVYWGHLQLECGLIHITCLSQVPSPAQNTLNLRHRMSFKIVER